MIDIRIICAPEEAGKAEAAVRSAFSVSSCRRYPARSGGVRLYISGTPRRDGKRPALPVVEHDLEDFKFNLAPIQGKNHVLVMASIPADQYVSLFYAKRLNDAIQRDIRGIIDSGIKDVYIRMDQTYKPTNPGYVLYNSGNVSQGIYIDDMGSAGYYGDEEPEDYE